MTPQERQLVDQLFDRLATLENEPRDPDAEQAIRDGVAHAPNALYALVQTALVQDEALRRANACAFRRSRSLVPTHRDQAFRSIASSVAWVREGTVGCLC